MKKITNPNFIYILTFIVPFFVYSLGWSTIYPALSVELFAFYAITFFLAFGLGVLIDRLPGFVYNRIPVFRYNGYVILSIYFFFIVDCAYMGYIPLFAYSGGDAAYGESGFGIPTLHIFGVTFTAFYALFIFHQLI